MGTRLYTLPLNIIPYMIASIAGVVPVSYTHLDVYKRQVQGFANAHRTLFLVIVFTFVIGAFAWNVYRLVTVYRHSPTSRTATEMQDSVLRERHKLLQEVEIREHKNRGDKPQ